MLNNSFAMEDVDLRVIIKSLIRKWYWFALSLIITFSIAYFYLAITSKEYLVESTIQLKDKSMGNNGMGGGDFLNSFELGSSDSELEDEIGILTSYSTVRQSLENINFEVSYFVFENFLGFGEIFAKEIYPAPFGVNLDSVGWQVLSTPIYISLVDDKQYRVRVSAEDRPYKLYSLSSHEIITSNELIHLDTVLSIDQSLRTSFLNFSLDYIDAANLDGDEQYFITLTSLNAITDNYYKRLATKPITENSNIIKLSLVGAAPQKDIFFLQKLSGVYIDNHLRKQNRLGEKTIEFIDYQLQGVTDSLQSTENTLENFRAKNQIIDVGVTSQTLTGQLYSLEEKHAQLNVQNKYYEYIEDYLVSSDDVTDIVAPSSVGIQDQMVSNLIVQLSELNQEKISKAYNSSKYNPVLQVLEKKIQSTKSTLIENILNLKATNEIALQENNRRVNEIRSTMNQLPENEINLIDIERRFNFNDNIYNYLLQKRAEAGIAIASNIPDKKIIDLPRQIGNGPIGPNKLFILLVALISGLLIPAGLIFTKDFFSPRLETEEQLKYWTKLPIIGRVTQVSEKETSDTFSGQTLLAHTFRYLREHISYLKLTQQIKTIGIASAKSGEGKTFCAQNLALSFAHSGRKTILVEADFYQPNLSKNFKVTAEPGLTDYMLGSKAPLVQKTDMPNLDIITSGKAHPNPSDLISNGHLENLVEELRNNYDIIIFDTSPVGLIADYLLISQHIDYTLLTIRQEYSEKEFIQRLDSFAKEYKWNAGIIYNGLKMTGGYKGYYQKK